MNKSIRKYFPIFVLPTLLAFIIAFVIPFIMGIYLSFTKFTTVNNSSWIGFDNFVNIFKKDNDFLHALWFTALFTLVSIITINIIAFALALLLTKAIKGTNIFRSIFFMPNLIGGIVLGYIWNLLINGVLAHIGVDITFAAKYGFWGLVIMMNWQMVGYMMVIYIAAIQNIPTELIEASQIDGASSFRTLFQIKLPMMMTSVTICTFLTLTNSFKLFDQNLALTAGAPIRETEMLALNIYKTFYNTPGSQGIGQAKAVVFFIIVAVIAYVQLRITRSKEVDQ